MCRMASATRCGFDTSVRLGLALEYLTAFRYRRSSRVILESTERTTPFMVGSGAVERIDLADEPLLAARIWFGSSDSAGNVA